MNAKDMKPQSQNIYVIESVWRRLKKGHIKLRDLQLVKDVTGGGGVTDKSSPRTGGVGQIGSPRP